MSDNTYTIILGTMSGGTDWLCLGTTTQADGTHVCSVAKYSHSSPAETWRLVSVPGSADSLGYYLQHAQTNLLARFGDSRAITLKNFSPVDHEFFVRLEHTGDGWTAINNHDNSLVMDATGKDPVVGAMVFPNKWNKGDNQRWRFIDSVLLPRR